MSETKTFTLPVSNQEVELKTSMTGREKRAIQSVYLDEMNVSMKGEEQEITGLSGALTTKSLDKAIETLVVRVDDKTSDLVNAVLDLDSRDYDVVVKEIEGVTNPKKKEEETN